MLVVVSEFGAYRGLGLKLRVILYGYVVIAHQHEDQITGKRKAPHHAQGKVSFADTHTHIHDSQSQNLTAQPQILNS